MLTKNQINELAEKYLLENKFPIVKNSGRVTLPNEDDDPETEGFLAENGIAEVSFISIYLNQPEHPQHELDPGVYIVYVDLSTGEVHMPRHM